MRMTTRRRLEALVGGIGEAAALYGVGRGRILARLVRLWRRYGFRPGEAHHEGLSNPGLSDEHLAGAIPEADLIALQLRVNRRDLVGLIEDKAVFYLYCRDAGLPVPRLLAVVDRPWGMSGDGAPLGARADYERVFERLDTDLFVKPAATDWGIGLRAYERTPAGFRDVETGETLNASALAESLTSSAFGRLVVQERLRNHDAIARLTATATVQTVRIQTVLTREGECVLGGCMFKLASGAHLADNVVGGQTGNFMAGVGLDDGVLRPAVRFRSSEVGLESVERHPRTGAPIAGFRLPDWAAATDLARRAAVRFAPLRTVGWDIALTPDGPVLVEGNLRWSPWNALAACPADLTYPREMAAILALLRSDPGPG